MRNHLLFHELPSFFAYITYLHFVTSFLPCICPSGIQPTLVLIFLSWIGSIIYGPRIGAILGLPMGLFSLTMNTCFNTSQLSL